MDPPDSNSDAEDIFYEPQSHQRSLPNDLPKSLDDRQPVREFGAETELYDAWQGQSQFLTSPVPAQPLSFNLSLDDGYDDEVTRQKLEDSDSRLMEMLAAQAAHREDGYAGENEESIAASNKLLEKEKKAILQRALHMAASNGDMERLDRLLHGTAKAYIDINAPDEEGTVPIIYASCFGHQEVVLSLLKAGAEVDKPDRNQWTSLMWALTNRHKDIAKTLLDHGASPKMKSSSGRTAYEFAAPNSEISDYLNQYGYAIGDAGVGDDFYDNGFSQDRFEQEMEENEMKRRMMMESSMNLEVDLSSLGMDERPESPEEVEERQEFVWDRCLHDQMFVFQENELESILHIIITKMTPQRTSSQKPIPANVLFLSARYAHYHASHDLLATLLISAMEKINAKVEFHQWDMTVLAFWISNATLLLHYLKKDTGLLSATVSFQVQLVELINEIFILIIRDAEKRMDKVLDRAILDHETIPFENLEFAGDWGIFRKKKVQTPEPVSYRRQPANKRSQPSPRNITSLLSSTLFVLDLYDIHSVITAQILAQLFYWIGAELFNRIISNRTYLARTKAMQIRMNISVLEDWARVNNRVPEHYENGSLSTSGENTVDAARKHFTPVIQLLQWLQCFSSLGDNADSLNSLENTLNQFTHLTPQQLLHASSHYRYEKEEKTLPKTARKHLIGLETESKKHRERIRREWSHDPTSPGPRTPSHSGKPEGKALDVLEDPQSPERPPSDETKNGFPLDGDDVHSDSLHMDTSHMLQFSLPTMVDLRVSYGAGLGGMDRERERKYIPTVPQEFLAKLDLSGSGNFLERKYWDDSAEDG